MICVFPADLSMDKVDIIFAPAAFTATTGRAHWETLDPVRVR